MAFHSASFVLLFTLLFLFNFTFASNTASVSHKGIKAICGHTQNPEFCVGSIEDYLGGRKADMNRLGIISVLLPAAQAGWNKDVVEQLVQTNHDPTTKTHLQKCLMDYDAILPKLRDAYVLSEKKDYKGMIDLVNDVTTMTNECTMECGQLENSFSDLKEYNQEMVWLNDIAHVILGMLDN